MAQQYAARSVGRRNATVEAKDNGTAQEPDYQRADFSRLDVIRPRSVGVERVARRDGS
jgi:hypothetical protein